MNFMLVALLTLLSASCPLLASVKGSGFCTPASAVSLRPSVEHSGISAFSLGLPSCPSFASVKESGVCTPASAIPLRPSVESIVNLLAELPSPSPAAFGHWLLSAVAALSILALGKQFMRKTPLEAEFLTKREFNQFRDRVDQSFKSVSDKLDSINKSLSDLGALVARLDERTKLNWPPPADRNRQSESADRKSP